MPDIISPASVVQPGVLVSADDENVVGGSGNWVGARVIGTVAGTANIPRRISVFASAEVRNDTAAQTSQVRYTLTDELGTVWVSSTLTITATAYSQQTSTQLDVAVMVGNVTVTMEQRGSGGVAYARNARCAVNAVV